MFGYTIGDPRDVLSFDTRDNAPFATLAAVIDPAFTWGDDRPPRTPWHKTVIYEMHVRGFSKLHPNVPKSLRGTYEVLTTESAVDQLQQLGVTAVELIPVHHHAYDRHLVSLEVILDVVYNHTAEGNHLDPTLSLRAIDNLSYYRFVPGDKRYYLDFTGCGNTLNMRSPQVLQLIMDSLSVGVPMISGGDELGRTQHGNNNACFRYHRSHAREASASSPRVRP